MKENRFHSKYIPEPNSGWWLWTGCEHHLGYGIIRWNKKTQKAHRVSWMIHRGPIPANMFILHHCDNPPCVNPDHLFIGNQSDNMADMSAKGRGKTGDRRGSKNSIARLKDGDIPLIRARASLGESQYKIALDYGVAVMTVNRVVRHETWGHIK